MIKVFYKAFSELLSQVLRHAGYLAVPVEGEWEVFSILRAMPVAVLITEWPMPEPGAGELIYWLRQDPSLEQTRTLLIIPPGAEEKDYQVVPDSVLSKPFSPKEFIRTVKCLSRGVGTEPSIRLPQTQGGTTQTHGTLAAPRDDSSVNIEWRSGVGEVTFDPVQTDEQRILENPVFWYAYQAQVLGGCC